MLNGGKHVEDHRLIYTKTSYLHAETLEKNNKMMINLDGEYGGDAPMTFKICINTLKFLQMVMHCRQCNYGFCLNW